MSDVTDLIERLRSSAEAFRRYPIYTSDGDPVRLTVQADELTEAADALERLTRPADVVEAARAWNRVLAGMQRFGMESTDIETVDEYFASIKQTDAVDADLTDEEQATVDFFTAAIRGAK